MGRQLILAVGLLAAGEAITLPGLGDVTQLSAVAVLAWVAWTQRQEMRTLRERINTQQIQQDQRMEGLTERHDRWEHQRHEDSIRLTETMSSDSKRLSETLGKLQATCSRVHGIIAEREG